MRHCKLGLEIGKTNSETTLHKRAQKEHTSYKHVYFLCADRNRTQPRRDIRDDSNAPMCSQYYCKFDNIPPFLTEVTFGEDSADDDTNQRKSILVSTFEAHAQKKRKPCRLSSFFFGQALMVALYACICLSNEYKKKETAGFPFVRWCIINTV